MNLNPFKLFKKQPIAKPVLPVEVCLGYLQADINGAWLSAIEYTEKSALSWDAEETIACLAEAKRLEQQIEYAVLHPDELVAWYQANVTQ